MPSAAVTNLHDVSATLPIDQGPVIRLAVQSKNYQTGQLVQSLLIISQH